MKKMTTNHSEEYLFHQRCDKTSTDFEMASQFLASLFAKLHFSPPNSPF